MPYFFADENEDSGYESDGGTKYRPYAELNKGTYSRVRQFRSINRRRQQKVVTVLSPISDNVGKMKYGEKSLAVRTLFTQEMLRQGFLASSGIYVSLAFKKQHTDKYLKAMDETFSILQRGIKENTVKKLLKGPVAQAGFTRLT